MEVSKSAVPAQGRQSVALDIVMLAGASIVAGLVTAAVAAALVIFLSGSVDASADAPEAPAPAKASASSTS